MNTEIYKNIYESNREILRYNECTPFYIVVPPVEIPVGGSTYVEFMID